MKAFLTVIAYVAGGLAAVTALGAVGLLVRPYPNPDATAAIIGFRAIIAVLLALLARWAWKRAARMPRR